MPTRSSSGRPENGTHQNGVEREAALEAESHTSSRRSTRRKEPVNYDLRRPLRNAGTHENKGKTVKARKRDVDEVAETSENSPKGPIYKSNVPAFTIDQSSKDPEVVKQNLVNIILDNTQKVDELFQLTHFTSLVSFEPKNINRSSEIYKSFVENYNLWSMRNKEIESEQDASTRRRNRRLGTVQHPLQSEIEKLVDEKLSEKLQPPEQPKVEKNQEEDPKLEPESKEPIQQNTPARTSRKRSRSIAEPLTPVPKTEVKKAAKSRTIKSKKVKPIEKQQNDEIEVDNTPEKKSGEEELESAEEDDLDYDSDDSDMMDIPVIDQYKDVKKIKASVKPPAPVVFNPEHVTKPLYGDLKSYLDSYKSLDEDLSLSEYDAYMKDQNKLVEKIRRAVYEKTLRVDLDENVDRTYWNQKEEPTMIKPAQRTAPFRDPFRYVSQPTNHDHLLAHGIFAAKLVADLRRQRVARCKRISQMIEVHFKRKAMSKEREQKEFEQKIMRLAKETGKIVKRKWLQAEKAWKILEDRRKEAERVQKGKQHLSEMLEHSTQLLEQQLLNRSESATMVASATSPSAKDEEENAVDESESEPDSDEFSSESEGEDEEATNGSDLKQEEDDSKLTLEQLKAKYESIDQEASLLPSKTNGTGLAALYNDTDTKTDKGDDNVDVTAYTEITEEEKAAIAREGPHDPLLDSDSSASEEDESSANSDDSGCSDTDGESASDSYETTEDKPTLASFFGGGAVVDDSDDESVNSDDEDIKSETSISTPDEAAHITPKSKESDEMTNEQVNTVPDVPTPPLLRGTLRVYQKQGLNWLASLYNNNTNGILADEMGLGKTIQTISLIAYLACEKHIWGPHLIVVPTSVMLNWEMEFKRFAPGFKVLTYYGSPQQRKEKRKGWNNPDSFHVCITSYQLVVHDHHAFRRKKWRYMILDEAHNIKNFRSQRWQALLNFNTEHRLLLTGTPLQNSIMELWSLLYFLMPSTKANQSMPAGFANLQDFQQWFGRPVDKIVEGGGTTAEADMETRKTVSKLHQVLRPYLLRRLKADVEKQMPAKYEHIVYCRLSKRQRYLYDDFMSRAQTKETLASGNFLSIINCLMQLRKVCNHPDLFEVRPIVTSFAMPQSVGASFSMKELVVRKNMQIKDYVDLNTVNAIFTGNEKMSYFNAQSLASLNGGQLLEKEAQKLEAVLSDRISENYQNLDSYYEYLKFKEQEEALSHTKHSIYLNNLRCNKFPVYGSQLLDMLSLRRPKSDCSAIGELINPLQTRSLLMRDSVEKYAFVTPAAIALDMKKMVIGDEETSKALIAQTANLDNPFHEAQMKLSIAFPDKGLLQYDCGKLQKLAVLLQQLKDNGHRALIFTQMTKVLDILELFLNYHGYRYMRLDGATKIEDRQILTERFNTDPRITCFILSTRSGGLGINLTGADTVVFYDSDWNPAMDKQCQDRCHRIGQTRDVHIYRFVSEYTIESNILRKANQKRHLDNVVIQDGDFTTDYFGKFSVTELIGEEMGVPADASRPLIPEENANNFTAALAQAEDEDDAAAANVAMKEVELDEADFEEQGAAGSRSTSATPLAAPIDGNALMAEENEDDVEFDEDDMGHIDEYMIRFIENGYYYG